MNYFKLCLQLSLILSFLYMGNFLANLLSHWMIIPGSIIGMMLLLLALILKIIKLKWVEEVSSIFLKHMGLFFIPLGVSLVESYVIFKSVALELLLLLVISNMFVMGITGMLTQKMVKKRGSNG